MTTCRKCQGWGSIETRKNVTGERVKLARICRTCDGSGKVSA